MNARHPQRARLEDIDSLQQQRPRESRASWLRQSGTANHFQEEEEGRHPGILGIRLKIVKQKRGLCVPTTGFRGGPTAVVQLLQFFSFNNTAASTTQTSRTTRPRNLSYLLPRFLSPIAALAAEQRCIVFGLLRERIRRFLCLQATVGSIAAVFNTWKAQRVEQRIYFSSHSLIAGESALQAPNALSSAIGVFHIYYSATRRQTFRTRGSTTAQKRIIAEN